MKLLPVTGYRTCLTVRSRIENRAYDPLSHLIPMQTGRLFAGDIYDVKFIIDAVFNTYNNGED
jgi:hypothetical protein